MSRLLVLAFVIVALLGPSGGAAAEKSSPLPEVRVVDTDPPAGRNLSRNWPLYVHLRYQSEVPLRVQVKGYFQGTEVKDGVSWNPSPAYRAGSGEAIAWIAFSKAAHLDELRMEVSDGGWNDLLVLKVPTNVAWSPMATERPPTAEWVDRFSDAQQQATEDGLKQLGGGALGELIGFLVMLSAPAYFQDALATLDLLQNPNTAVALNYRGYATRKLGRTDEGIGYYLQSVAIDPAYPQVREYLGEAYVIKGQLDLANAQLTTIASLCGTTCEYYTDLAEAIAAAN
jgi:hypothetical protein